jgi:hypothetical protein
MSRATVPSRRMQGVVTEKQFNKMSTEKKMQIIEKVFGKEVPA